MDAHWYTENFKIHRRSQNSSSPRCVFSRKKFTISPRSSSLLLSLQVVKNRTQCRNFMRSRVVILLHFFRHRMNHSILGLVVSPRIYQRQNFVPRKEGLFSTYWSGSESSRTWHAIEFSETRNGICVGKKLHVRYRIIPPSFQVPQIPPLPMKFPRQYCRSQIVRTVGTVGSYCSLAPTSIRKSFELSISVHAHTGRKKKKK